MNASIRFVVRSSCWASGITNLRVRLGLGAAEGGVEAQLMGSPGVRLHPDARAVLEVGVRGRELGRLVRCGRERAHELRDRMRDGVLLVVAGHDERDFCVEALGHVIRD